MPFSFTGMVFQEGIVYIYVIMLPSQSAKMALFMVAYDMWQDKYLIIEEIVSPMV